MLLFAPLLQGEGIIAKAGKKTDRGEIFPGNAVPEIGKVLQKHSRYYHRDRRWSDSSSLTQGRLAEKYLVHAYTREGKSHWLSTRWMLGSVHDAFPAFTQSSPKPWEVDSIIPRLQERKQSSINLIYLFSAMRNMSLGTPNSKSVVIFSLYHTTNVSLG